KGNQKELQADQHNCWVFAFDHIVQRSKIDIFNFLNKKTAVQRENTLIYHGSISQGNLSEMPNPPTF
ncbi:MAG: hypothetical protein ACI9S8_001787, partial [Chlamydiales bacterium]